MKGIPSVCRRAAFAVAVILLSVALYVGLGMINARTSLLLCVDGRFELASLDTQMSLLAGDWRCYSGMLSPNELADAQGTIRDVMRMGIMEGYTYEFELDGSAPADVCFMLPRSRGSRLFLDGREVLGVGGGAIEASDVFSLRECLDQGERHLLVLQIPISGYFYSGYQGIVFGGREQLLAIGNVRYFIELICLGLYAALCMICLLLFAQKTSEHYIPLFGLFVLVTAYRFVSYSERLSPYLPMLGDAQIYRFFFFMRYMLCRVFVPSGEKRSLDMLMIAMVAVDTVALLIFQQGFTRVTDWLNLMALMMEGAVILRGLMQGRQGTHALLIGWSLYTSMEFFYRALTYGLLPQGIVDVLIRPTQYVHAIYLLAFASAILGKFAGKFREAEELAASLEHQVAEQTSALRETNARIVAVQEQRERFLTDIVHNLRNPLFALGGYFELLQDEMSAPTQKQREYLELIGNKLAYVEGMVADMLLFNRLENGKIAFHFVDMQAKEFLEEVLRANRLVERCAQVTLDCDETLSLCADGFRLHQALDNLLDNAVVHGKCTSLTLSMRQTRDETRLVIEDDGQGMDEAQRSRAFDRYVSGGEKNSAGLGLAIAREIVHGHKGSIELCSEPEKGTTVTISLPRVLTA